MKVLMAVSLDGFVARHERDDMSWTGDTDKKIFRLLSLATDGPILVGRKTALVMPELSDRPRIVISRGEHEVPLSEAERSFPNSWLCGGPTVVEAAISAGIVSRMVLVQVPAVLQEGITFDRFRWTWTMLPKHIVQINEARVQIFVNPEYRHDGY